MWLREELQKIQTNSLSVRQQLDLIQDNAYIRCNLHSIISTSNFFVTVNKQAGNSGDAHRIRVIKEFNLAWDNIQTYLNTFFPIVWKAICESDALLINSTETNPPPSIRDINLRTQSCKKILEVAKTLVYGGSLRLPFSQDSRVQHLYRILLLSCQHSDISGINLVSGQNRISFLQTWLEKLVLKHSLSSYFIEQIGFSSPKIIFRSEPAQITATKFTVSKIPIIKGNICGNLNSLDSPQSPKSADTTFSEYINSDKQKPPEFVGLKIKFTSENSDSSCSTDDSENSVWDPVFKKRKI